MTNKNKLNYDQHIIDVVKAEMEKEKQNHGAALFMHLFISSSGALISILSIWVFYLTRFTFVGGIILTSGIFVSIMMMHGMVRDLSDKYRIR